MKGGYYFASPISSSAQGHKARPQLNYIQSDSANARLLGTGDSHSHSQGANIKGSVGTRISSKGARSDVCGSCEASRQAYHTSEAGPATTSDRDEMNGATGNGQAHIKLVANQKAGRQVLRAEKVKSLEVCDTWMSPSH